jgi:hypothetical protein
MKNTPIKEALDKLFTKRVEQVRVSDVERAVGRKIMDAEWWTYHMAGVFMYNYSMVYNYNRSATIPDTITPIEPSDLERAAGSIKKVRVKKSKPLVGREKATELATRNAIDVTKYAHLDNGRLAMVVNNLLRAREKRGEEVKW